MCVYPIVTLLILALTNLEAQLPLWQQTLILTMILVPSMILVIAPKVGMAIERITK